MKPSGAKKKLEERADGAAAAAAIECVDACSVCTMAGAPMRGDHKSLYRQLLAGLYDAILITDPNGHIIETNVRAEEFFQFKEIEIRDAMVGELICGIDASLLGRARKGLAQGRLVVLDARCLRKDGTTFAGEVSISVIKMESDDNLVFAVRNVDRRKHAWKKMRSGQNAWQASLAAGFILDAAGSVCCANRAAVAMWRQAGEDAFEGQPFAGLWVDAGAVEDALRTAAAKKAWHGELEAAVVGGERIRAKVFIEFDVAERGSDGGYLCSVLPAGERG